MDFVTRWLPDSGTSTSPQLHGFGMSHLMLACDAADRCLGTKYLKLPFSRTPSASACRPSRRLGRCLWLWRFKGFGDYNSYLFRCVSANQDSDGQAAVEDLYRPGAGL